MVIICLRVTRLIQKNTFFIFINLINFYYYFFFIKSFYENNMRKPSLMQVADGFVRANPSIAI